MSKELLLASALNDVKKVEEILKNYSGKTSDLLNFRDEGNRTALSIAACNGHDQIVFLLIEFMKKDLECDLNFNFKQSINPFVEMIQGSKFNIKIAKFLIMSGGFSIYDFEKGRTGVHLAALYLNKEALLFFLEGCININEPDNDGNTPLMMSVQSCFAYESANANNAYEIIQMLLDKGSNIYLKNKFRWSAFRYVSNQLNDENCKNAQRIMKLLLGDRFIAQPYLLPISPKAIEPKLSESPIQSSALCDDSLESLDMGRPNSPWMHYKTSSPDAMVDVDEDDITRDVSWDTRSEFQIAFELRQKPEFKKDKELVALKTPALSRAASHISPKSLNSDKSSPFSGSDPSSSSSSNSSSHSSKSSSSSRGSPSFLPSYIHGKRPLNILSDSLIQHSDSPPGIESPGKRRKKENTPPLSPNSAVKENVIVLTENYKNSPIGSKRKRI